MTEKDKGFLTGALVALIMSFITVNKFGFPTCLIVSVPFGFIIGIISSYIE